MKKFIILFFFLSTSISWVQAQSKEDVQLANEYYSQGEYEKAKKLYNDLARDVNNIPLIHNNYFFLLMDTGDFSEAEKYIRKLIKRFPHNLYYQLDLGVVYQNSGDQLKAQNYFNALIDEVKTDNYRTRITADYFVNKQLTPLAIKTFKDARTALQNPYAYALEMANIYRIMNEKDLMVEEYLNYVSQNPSNLNYVKNTLQSLLVKPEELESLEMLLYDKIQNEPNSEIYSELLIWVNLQQKNFYGAFVQAKAIDKRLKTEGSRSVHIGMIALENDDFDNAIKIFTYIIKTYPGTYNYILARMHLIRSYEKRVKNTYPLDEREIRNLINDYNEFITEMGVSRNTLEALRNKALLHAFYLDEKDSAVQILKEIISSPRANPDLKAKSKLDLGDIYILTEEPWEATLLYSQVEKSEKEERLGYEAKLRNAKLSYFKGEFQLAQEHLDILKQATTREIANDAMALSLLIKDNIAFDSTETAMKKYAAIELLLFQNKIEESLAAIEKMRQEYSGHSLSDELLWLQADIEKKLGNFEKAITLLEKIVTEFDYDILSDDAYFQIGAIYDRHLENKEEAMNYYREFLTRYPGSVYVAEARKRFRLLRGDNNNQEQFNNNEL